MSSPHTTVVVLLTIIPKLTTKALKSMFNALRNHNGDPDIDERKYIISSELKSRNKRK